MLRCVETTIRAAMYGSNGSNIIGFLLIGGPGFVFSGLRSLNEKRLIENMPRSKVRSAAMGLVEMYGIAIAKSPQIAPISGLPCCWWHYRVEELRSSG